MLKSSLKIQNIYNRVNHETLKLAEKGRTLMKALKNKNKKITIKLISVGLLHVSVFYIYPYT